MKTMNSNPVKTNYTVSTVEVATLHIDGLAISRKRRRKYRRYGKRQRKAK